MFLCSDCKIIDNSAVVEDRKPEPIKMKILRTLGLDSFLIDRLLIRRAETSYTFNRQHLSQIETDQCSIPVLHIPLLNPSESTLFLYSHGSDSNLNKVYGFIKKIQELYGVSVMSYDYTGYGQSRKKTGRLIDDIKAVFQWAVSLGYKPSKIIMVGFSLGSYAALAIPGPMPRCLLAPISGITSFLEGQVHHYQNQPFDNIEAAKAIVSPVFIVHSLNDHVPVDHSRILYKTLARNRARSEGMKIQYYEVGRYTHSNLVSYLGISCVIFSLGAKQLLKVSIGDRQRNRTAEVKQYRSVRIQT